MLLTCTICLTVFIEYSQSQLPALQKETTSVKTILVTRNWKHFG